MRRKLRSALLALAVGATPLITTATCDPVTGGLDFYRDDDYSDYYYEDVYVVDYYEDCFLFYCY